MVIDRPEDFFRTLHPANHTSGQIVIERKIDRSFRQSQIQPKELEMISRLAYGIPDISFSVSTFSGAPLALNFKQTSCLHLQVPEYDSLTFLRLTSKLGASNIPVPTAALSDGEFLTLLWVLDKPIPAHEFYLYALLEKKLCEAAAEFTPTQVNLDINFRTRMVGSVNSNNGNNAVISRFSGRTHNKSHLQNVLFSKPMLIQEYQHLQKQAGLILELKTLFGDRFFENSRYPELYYDWILFFGASLCYFVTANQLKCELRAIAESLENQPWKEISFKYSELIDSISTTACDGYIDYQGTSISTTQYDWHTWVAGKLQIIEREINELDLHLLGDLSSISPHIHSKNKPTISMGADRFEPLTRLLIKQAK